MKTRFTITPVKMGYHYSTLEVIKVETDVTDIATKVGHKLDTNDVFTMVSNGVEVLLVPKNG